MKRVFLLIILFFICNIIYAEKVEFTASAPKVVALGEQFSLTFSINERGKNLQVPQFENFHLLMSLMER